MRLLLDTHAAVMWVADDADLSIDATAAIEDPESVTLLSAVVAWEVAIKRGLGKLDVPPDYVQVLLRAGVDPLPISLDHARRVESLPGLHRDPFDRMLVAQAIAEDATIVTRDRRIAQYDVPVLW